jgi:hypothetical protein
MTPPLFSHTPLFISLPFRWLINSATRRRARYAQRAERERERADARCITTPTLPLLPIFIIDAFVSLFHFISLRYCRH